MAAAGDATAASGGGSDSSGGSGVLGGLGVFHIWTELLLGPLAIIFLIWVTVVVWNYQVGWTHTQGTVQDTPACVPCAGNQCQQGDGFVCEHTELLVKGVKGKNATWDATVISPSELHVKDVVAVCYDPKDPSKHATTTGCMPATIRGLLRILLVLAIIFAIGWWVINLVFRHNKTFQQASGVLEGADIAQSIFGNR